MMTSEAGRKIRPQAAASWRALVLSDVGILVMLALAKVLLHVLTNHQYGFHRDELALLDDGRYLAWGYVSYPPFAVFMARIGHELFGISLVGIRLFSALAQGAVMLLVGLMARDLGGNRLAQVVAALAAGISLATLGFGSLFQYVTYDYLWWVLLAYFVIRLLKTDNPRWWLGIGAAVGLGMMTKYTMAYFVVGVAAGILLTRARRYLLNKWLWAGVALSLLIVLPNLIWQIQHDFISLDFLRSIHARDITNGRTEDFLVGQLLISVNPFVLPLWAAGLFFFLFAAQGKPFRPVAWMFLVPLALFAATQGRPYYIAPAYPMILAGGAVIGERWVTSLKPGWARVVMGVTGAALAIGGVIAGALMLPIAPINSPMWDTTADMVDLYVEQIGWPEFVGAVAEVYDTLPADEQAHTVIIAANPGAAGALNLYGPSYGLPEARSRANTGWLRGYGGAQPQTAILVGFPSAPAGYFYQCETAGRISNPYGVMTEEMERPFIYVCREPRSPWPDLWARLQLFA